MSLILPKHSAVQGFARARGESDFPGLWEKVAGIWAPSVGPQGGVLRDWSGHGWHGTLTNMDPATDWQPGPKGYALDFDGSNDYVSISTAFTLVPPFSISAWVYQANVSSFRNILTKRDSFSSTAMVWQFDITNGLPRLFHGTSASTFNSQPALTANVWNHVLVVSTGNRMYCCVNGRSHGDFPFSTAIGTGTNATVQISGFNGSNELFVGRIGDVIAWRRAVSPDEALVLTQGGSPLTLRRRRTFFVPAGGGGTAHTLSVSDSLSFSDSPAKQPSIPKVESITISDAKSLLTGKNISESVTLADAKALSSGKVLSDSFSLGDSFSGAIVIALSVSDSLSFSDSKVFQVGKALTETVSLSDSFERTASYIRAFSDSLAMADSATAVNPDAEVEEETVEIRWGKYLKDKRRIAREMAVNKRLQKLSRLRL